MGNSEAAVVRPPTFSGRVAGQNADELAARLKSAEATLEKDEASIATERAAIEAETADKRTVLAQSDRDRSTVVLEMGRGALELFVTDRPQSFAAVAERFLGEGLPEVRQIDLLVG